MARLTNHERHLLAQVPAGQTKTIAGAATAEVCWNWALYGNAGNPVEPGNLFGVVNVAAGDPFAILPTMQALLPAGGWFSEGERAWATRQRTKHRWCPK